MDDTMHRRLAHQPKPDPGREARMRQVADDKTLLEEILEHPRLQDRTRNLIETWLTLPAAGRALTVGQRTKAEEIRAELDRGRREYRRRW